MLAYIRFWNGISQRELAEAIGVSSATISALELRKCRPSHRTLRSFQNLFGCEWDKNSIQATPPPPSKLRKKARKARK